MKATARTKVHVSRVPTALNSAAVCPSTLAARVRLTSVTIAVTANVSPTTVSLQGNSPAGKIAHTDIIY